MFKEKDSFFKKMVGAINADHDDDTELLDEEVETDNEIAETEEGEDWMEEAVEEAQLSIDMRQTPKEIVIETIVAGVRPDDLDVSINREMVSIRGSRTKTKSHSTDDYFHEELYWGGFSRTIILPQEIDVEESEAKIHNGLLTITLPKMDKNKTHKLKVKAGH